MEERRQEHRRAEDCIHADRLDRMETMILGTDGWLAHQKMVLRELERTSEKLEDILAQQSNMLSNQSAMETEIRGLKKSASAWGGGLGAFLGALAAVLMKVMGFPS